jgi:flagellar biosynthesis/type III secretory pathway chaperone
MESWEKELITALEKEQKILEELSSVAESKTELLVSGNLEGLDKVLAVEQPLAIKLQLAEKNRLELLEKAGLSDLTLSRIAEKAGGQTETVLRGYVKTLSELSEKLKTVNELNMKITADRLEFYRKLTAAAADPTVYEVDGKIRGEQDNLGIIDKKA